MRHSLIVTSLLATAAIATFAGAQTAPAENPLAKAAIGPVQPATANHAQLGDFGIDRAGMATSVMPGDDFYRYVNGIWQDKTTIPADRSSYGMFHALQDLSLDRTKGILEAAQQQPGSKIGDFYASFMDEAAVNAKGVAPVKPWLAAIKAAGDKTALATEMARLARIGVGGLVTLRIGQDDKHPDRYIATMYQAGLGMPDRDYYLKDSPELDATRTAYKAYLAKMLTLAGEANAAARADAVYAFEKALATAHWDNVKTRDADLNYNIWKPADFAGQAGGFPWQAYLAAAGIDGQAAYLVGQPSAVAGEAKAFAAAPLAVLKDYVTLKLLNSYASYLSKPFDDAHFAFYGTALSGTPEQQLRWKRGVSTVSGNMGEEIGKVYVAKYFPPEAKAAVDQLVKNLIAAMGARIDKLDWMAPETKAKAHEKLAAFTPKLGYPDTWRDYSALQIKRDDLVGNVARARGFEYQRKLNHLGQPIDRGEWFMTPMTINAYANPTMNEIVFPAAILQPPFFDPKADPAVNYGGIGAVIGHEISHHFDDQGRKYDKNGALADWWTPQDVTRFKVFTDKLVAQYDAYEPLPGLHVKGGLTLGENIADLAGLTVAIDAYHRSLDGKPAPVLDGTTGDQRFYEGWAQVWRTKYREPALRAQLLADEHAPGEQRAATVRNLDPWYQAFDVKPGQKMYLAPAERVRIW
ncbi:M13 family metallopeptidase [Hephaestia sp. GCM10023244]|uniref:M13 family metallopeptidase n=1 Tax=unclassified Hephaestia TaxID=2631281 RepID=UPI0020773907|nr:M13-type metalloendopeptidase [Hephaestia sp. MAHUQ-44]MCM8731325.1 M13 family peptidase [Hephaestia sp. MAHUQ-44]